MRIPPVLAGLAAVVVAAVSVTAQSSDGFRFRSGVELVNVTATVTDDSGRFVPGLRKEDFTVYDDGVRQEVSHFSSDRVPVSLGIVLDTSGSMTSDKIATAQAAIDRFIYELLGKDDACDLRAGALIERDFHVGRAHLCAQMPPMNVCQFLADFQPQPKEKRNLGCGRVLRKFGANVEISFLNDIGRIDSTLKPAVHAQFDHPL